MDDARAFERACEYLAGERKRPWKTAGYVSRRLRKRYPDFPAAKRLEELFLAHAQQQDRVVRYSFFPARKSLDLLWGHKEAVKDFAELPSPELVEELAGEFEEVKIAPDAPWIFVSHSFRDLADVRKIHRRLSRHGYGVWLAETQILKNQMIHERVQEGLRGADRFALYLTSCSLASRWVLKEGLVAVASFGHAPVLILPGNDKRIVDLAKRWLARGWDAGFDETLSRVLEDAGQPTERAPTPLEDLLQALLQRMQRDERSLSVFPDGRAHGLPSFDDIFPAVGRS